MGEAKRRKASDPNYGKPQQLERGLLISPPMAVSQDGALHIKSSQLDLQELRFSLLFWDRLAWPRNNLIEIASGPEAEFLISAGVLSRPGYNVGLQGDIGGAVLESYIRAFFELNAAAPGRWSLSQGDSALLIEKGLLTEGRSAYVQLHRAIPVPSVDVPLEDILSFRQRRRDELQVLRSEIDSLYSSMAKASDSEFELVRLTDNIDKACCDVLRLGREMQFEMRRSDLKASFDFDLAKITGWAVAGEAIGRTFNLPIVGAAFGGVLSTLKLGWDSSAPKSRFGEHPYRYTYQIQSELG